MYRVGHPYMGDGPLLYAKTFTSDGKFFCEVVLFKLMGPEEAEIDGEGIDAIRLFGERFRNYVSAELPYRVEIAVDVKGTIESHIEWLGENIKTAWSLMVWPTAYGVDNVSAHSYTVFFMFENLADATLFKIRFIDENAINHPAYESA